MQRRNQPAVDQALRPMHGVSRQGQPLSHNRAPSADLAPWIAGLYVTVVEAPEDYRIACGLFNDNSAIRIQLRGQWTAETRDGPMELDRAALHFGPHSRMMPIGVTGSFTSIGISLRPGAGPAVMGTKTEEFVDRIVPLDALGMPGQQVLAALSPDMSSDDMMNLLEKFARQLVDRTGAPPPDPISSRFEAQAFVDPGVSIASFAQECGIGQRQLERIIRRDFGMSPKQVMRRARALDMASYLRGVADEEEGDELALRYYDQSHLTRDFTELFGMAPGQFAATAQPIMTLTLESRQARRLEVMARLAPGARRPWE